MDEQLYVTRINGLEKEQGITRLEIALTKEQIRKIYSEDGVIIESLTLPMEIAITRQDERY